MMKLALVPIVVLALAWPARAQPGAPAGPHWPDGRRIRVWIDQALAPPGADALVGRAMRTWTTAADGHLTLVPEPVESDSDMRVHFVRSGSGLYGQSRPLVDEQTGAIIAAEVFITGEVAGDPLDRQIVLYLTALHEIGHALGLAHTDEFTSIMYAFRLPGDGERFFGRYRNLLRTAADIGTATATGLSPRDVAVLRSLYTP